MSAFDWLFLVVVGGLCAAYCASGYFVGYAHRNADDTALLRRLARTSRDAGYASLAMNKNRVQLLADAEAAETWADRLAPVAECDTNKGGVK